MNLLKMLILLGAALAFSAMAQASRWQLLGKSDEGSIYADTQSIGKVGNRVKIWFKMTHARPQEIPGSSPRQTMQSTKALVSFDCAARMMIILEFVSYANIDATGKEVDSSSTEDKPSGYKNVAPESAGEALLNYACHS